MIKQPTVDWVYVAITTGFVPENIDKYIPPLPWEPIDYKKRIKEYGDEQRNSKKD